MSDLRWIAALLSPRDVGQHANFSSEGSGDPPSKLADFVSAYRRARWTGRDDAVGATSQPNDESPEASLVELVRGAFSADTGRVSATELHGRLYSIIDLDLAARTALTILCCVALAEQDRLQDAIEVVENALSFIDASTSEASLLRGLLMQQANLRRIEFGSFDSLYDTNQITNLFAAVNVDVLPTFSVSVSVNWTSYRTMTNIRAACLNAAREMDLALREDVQSDGWVELVRSVPAELDLQSDSATSSAYSAWFKDAYSELTEFGSSTTFGSPRPRESELWSALLYEEILAGRGVQARRNELARFRFVQGAAQGELWLLRESVTLFRHADNESDLDRAIRYLRINGPLEALSQDAHNVIEQRLDPRLLHGSDVRVLLGAAETLSAAEAASALDVVLQALDVEAPRLIGRWGARSQRDEQLILCAVALSERTNSADKVWRKLLQVVSRNPGDFLYDLAVTRAITRLSWEEASETTREAWSDWLDQARVDRVTNEIEARHTRSAIEDLLEPDSPLPVRGIDDLARQVDRARRVDEIPPTSAIDVKGALGLLRPALNDIRSEAHRGVYSGGGVSVTALAALLVTVFRLDALSDDLEAVLLDTRVRRQDTAQALEILARYAHRTPAHLVAVLNRRRDEILFQDESPFDGRKIEPYPAALRLLLATEALGSDAALQYVSALAFARDSESRVEAAKCVITIARSRSKAPDDWVSVVALGLSEDAEGLVAANCAAAIALLLAREPRRASLLSHRLCELLAKDGITIPSFALGALAESSAAVSPELRAALATVREEHMVWELRERASLILQGR